jgi:hypothetical protein
MLRATNAFDKIAVRNKFDKHRYDLCGVQGEGSEVPGAIEPCTI